MCRLTLNTVAGGGSLPADTVNSGTEPRGDPYYLPAWVSGPNLNNNSCGSAGTGAYGNDAAWALKYVSHGVYDLVGSAYTEGSGNAIHSKADWSTTTGNTTVLRISDSIANIAAGMTVTSSDTGWPGCPSNCAIFTVTSVVQRATGPDQSATNANDDGYNGEIILSQPLGQTFSGDPLDVKFYSAAYSDSNPCQNTKPTGGAEGGGNCLFLNAAERYVAGYSPAGTATARLPASRGGHMGAGFLVDGIAGLRAINSNTFGHYYNIAAIDSGNCSFYQLAGDDNGEVNAGNSVGLYATGGSRGCLFVGKGPGKPGTSIVNDTFGVADDSTTEIANAIVSTLGAYGTPTITLPSGSSTSNWPTHGEMHICKQLPCGGGSVPGTRDDEIVAYAKVPGSPTQFDIIARGRFGTAPVDWSTTPSATLFLSVINGGTKTHLDKSASTIYSDLADNTTTAANQFEVHHGAATLDNLHTSGGGIGFVSSNTAGVTVTAANLASTSLVFEDSNAQILTTVSPDSQFANYAPPGITNLPVSALNPGGAQQTMVDLSALGANQTGTITVSSNANWPQNGVLLADTEEMGFALPSNGSTQQLAITSRGQCGTTPAVHGNSVTIQFIVTELPCGAPGLKGYANNGFTIGSPTLGDRGAGTLNAEAIYRNGAALGAANWSGGATTNNQAGGSTAFYPCQGFVAGGGLTEPPFSSLTSVAGTLRNLRVFLSGAPGLTATATMTVRVNGSSTALTCTATGLATTCTDLSNAATIAAGQICSVQTVLSPGAAGARIRASLEFDN